jgi:hypothetical protein
MSAPQPAPADPQPSVEDSAARAERHMLTLKRLTEKGMEVAEATPVDGTTASAETFAKVSRAIRLTIILEAKISADQDARRAGVVPRTEPAPVRAKNKNLAPNRDNDLDSDLGEAPYPSLHSGAKGLARGLTIEVLDREIPDPEEWDEAVEALDERLLYDAAYDTVDGVPLRDIVERLCADLDIKPDWTLWNGQGWVNPRPSSESVSRCSPRPTAASERLRLSL